MLEEHTAERLSFAQTFQVLPGDVPWKILAFFAAPDDPPDDLTMTSFMDTADLVIRADGRKAVQNPLVAAWMDLKIELRAACGGAGFLPNLLTAAARAKLSATWPEGQEFDAASVSDENLGNVVKHLGKFWPQGCPEWAQSLKERHDKARAARAAAKAEATAVAAALALEGASAAGAPEAADKPPEDAPFSVGDIIKLNETAAKKFVGEEAIVTSVAAKTVTTDVLTGKNQIKGKSFKFSQCIVVRKAQAARPKRGRPPAAEGKDDEEHPVADAAVLASKSANNELTAEESKQMASSLFGIDDD